MSEQTPTEARTNGLTRAQLEQLAEKVYRLLREDLRREQARLGRPPRRGGTR